MMIVGVLRGGGDTKFAMLLEIGSVWLIGVPMAFISTVILKLPVNIVVALIMILMNAIYNKYKARFSKDKKDVKTIEQKY